MKGVWFLLTAALAVASCKPQNSRSTPPEAKQPAEAKATTSSGELVAGFPLLPMIEKSLWSQLLEAETRQVAAGPAEREVADKEVERLTRKLRSRHPFHMTSQRLELGVITYDMTQARFSLPARVQYPDPGDSRHPGELEVLLCSESGRSHETLFVSAARPLHLELLMHLAGYAKGPQGKRFRIEVLTETGERIAVDSLIRVQGTDALKAPLLWEFSGSDYNDVYSPDLSGDFVIFWHAHDAVLRVDHDGIASGVVKLAAVPHSLLKNGEQVMLEFIPQ